MIASSGGQLLVRALLDEVTIVATGPLRTVQLDLPAPGLTFVIALQFFDRDISRPELTPYSCLNGVCEDPESPLDECNDGIDNDADGHADLCDWNCLPHADYGAESFPEAHARIEAGKTYALMGHGSLCTMRPDTWEIEFADTALKSAELLNSLRPDLERPIYYRTFSCWVFEDIEAYQHCQFGPYSVVDGEPVYDPPICPPGMEGYPYQPTEQDQLSAVDQSNLLFEEAIFRAWQDFELSADALGELAEPANGVVLLTSDLLATCSRDEFPYCPSAGGRGVLSLSDDLERRGSAVVTDEPDLAGMWTTLSHEVGHTIGLVHDDYPNGFMNKSSGTEAGLGTSIDDLYPNFDNKLRWEHGLTGSKGENPRSPGFYLTGCNSLSDCAPLGKPGWSCQGIICLEN